MLPRPSSVSLLHGQTLAARARCFSRFCFCNGLIDSISPHHHGTAKSPTPSVFGTDCYLPSKICSGFHPCRIDVLSGDFLLTRNHLFDTQPWLTSGHRHVCDRDVVTTIGYPTLYNNNCIDLNQLIQFRHCT